MRLSMRNLLYLLDGAALVGVITFSLLGALFPETRGYVVGQIICAVLVLVSVVLLRRYPN